MKIGYNFEYRFEEHRSSEGKPYVVIDEKQWLQGRTRVEQIISPYPYGHGRCEDSAVEAIGEAFQDFFRGASELDMIVREGFGPWRQSRWVIENCTMSDDFLKGFMTSLSRLNRVTISASASHGDSN